MKRLLLLAALAFAALPATAQPDSINLSCSFPEFQSDVWYELTLEPEKGIVRQVFVTSGESWISKAFYSPSKIRWRYESSNVSVSFTLDRISGELKSSWEGEGANGSTYAAHQIGWYSGWTDESQNCSVVQNPANRKF